MVLVFFLQHMVLFPTQWIYGLGTFQKVKVLQTMRPVTVCELQRSVSGGTQFVAEWPGSQAAQRMHHFAVTSNSWPSGQNASPRYLLFSSFEGRKPATINAGINQIAQSPLCPESCIRRATAHNSEVNKNTVERENTKTRITSIGRARPLDAPSNARDTNCEGIINSWNHQNSARDAVKSHVNDFLRPMTTDCWNVT